MEIAVKASQRMSCYPFTGIHSDHSGFFVERTAPLIPQEFITFFAASLAADGALVGLLFVAIAIEPERTFGEADPERELAANGVFSALVNAFVISMLALIPRFEIGWGVIVVAGLSLVSTIVHTADKLHRGQRMFNRTLVYTLGGLLLFSLEIYYSIEIIQHPQSSLDGLYGLIFVLVAVYGVALTRAWTLLGAESRTFTRMFLDIFTGRRAARTSLPTSDEKHSTPPV
jgi:hypothetical protein